MDSIILQSIDKVLRLPKNDSERTGLKALNGNRNSHTCSHPPTSTVLSSFLAIYVGIP
jgi:hypothetical protein